MAKYSVELRELVEQGVKIFPSDYPIYDENHRSELERKIIDHYYFREIGFETVARFTHHLKVKLTAIMPKMNRIYRTLAENEINIFSNFKTENDEQITGKVIASGENDNTVTTTHEVDTTNNQTTTLDGEHQSTVVVDRDTTNTNTNVVDGEGTNDTTESGTNEHMMSDTPQGRLTLTEGDYASELTKDTATKTTGNTTTVDTTTTDEGSSTENATTTDTGTQDSITTVIGSGSEDGTSTTTNIGTTGATTDSTNVRTGGSTGYTGITETELLEIYLKANHNVDNLIIAELSDLFMQVY